MKTFKQNISLSERIISRLIQIFGYSAVIFVIMILFFLLNEGVPAIFEVPLKNLFSTRWYPIEGYFGLLPLILGSLIVTIGATLVAVPFGVGTAIYISEIAPGWLKEVLKPLVEILAGLPSVMLGFLGMLVFAPFLRRLLNIPTGLTAFTGAMLLGAIAIPTIVSVSEDALNNVPRSYREGALALGATRWQTIWGVTLPAARSGVLMGVVLGVGRAIGETMTVMMVTGNAPVMLHGLDFFFTPVRTMTATIASEMGEVASGSVHYHVLFLIGILLFLISLAVNITAQAIVYRQPKRSERILS
jgi:phosphate transport system permease protein